MKKTIIGSTLALASAVAMAQPVTVTLSSASPMTQGMAMVLADQMQAQGAQVDILLCDQAGDLALKSNESQALKPKNVSPSQMLDAVMQKGATASVCALYLPNSGNAAAALKDGIKPAKPDDMARSLLEKERQVFSF